MLQILIQTKNEASPINHTLNRPGSMSMVVVVYRTRKKNYIYIYFFWGGFLFPVRWSVNEFVIMGSLIKMVIVPRRDSSRQRGNEWQSKDVCWETGLRLIKLVGFHLIHYSAR